MLLTSAGGHTPRIYTRDASRNHATNQQTQQNHQSQSQSQPLVLSLSQIQGGGGLLILNSSPSTSTTSMSHQSLVSPLAVTSFVCNSSRSQQQLQGRHHTKSKNQIVLKQEAMDTSSCCHPDNSNKMDVTNGNISELYELNFNNKSAASTPSKQHMDTNNFCGGETVVLLGEKSDHGSNGFFNETLDLSHEDIQRTLSANMPMCELDQGSRHSSTGTNSATGRSGGKTASEDASQDAGVIVSEMNPMDFMDGRFGWMFLGLQYL